MKSSTSKIIMGAILIMVVTLAIILGLLLVFLVEFFCSLLLSRRQRSKTPVNSGTTSITQPSPQCQRSKRGTNFAITSTTQPPPLECQSIAPITSSHSSFYAQLGVLHVPRTYLFPKISTKDHHNIDDLEIVQNMSYPKLVHEVQSHQCSTSSTTIEEQFIYISNPIYDNTKIDHDTPFETPDTSPSCLELIIDSSSEEGEENCGISTCSSTPSSVLLTPMKKLPIEACSISLRSGSINSNNYTSSSGSPCTSPSW
ncbi:uncharacterized protein LOC125811467 [Solanum verrucosum]|uniref:uncharacterized protein LOC125811467 n=1 Tax=Solanum verrucosum TaxID=315347 RepID=UPI0020D04681|nr:uncharacterized protein LOC125811467 [Solanum verrucosum]